MYNKDDSNINWKDKAVRRQKENKELHKRIREIKEGRDKWKEKFQKDREVTIKLEKEIDRIKKNLGKIIH